MDKKSRRYNFWIYTRRLSDDNSIDIIEIVKKVFSDEFKSDIEKIEVINNKQLTRKIKGRDIVNVIDIVFKSSPDKFKKFSEYFNKSYSDRLVNIYSEKLCNPNLLNSKNAYVVSKLLKKDNSNNENSGENGSEK